MLFAMGDLFLPIISFLNKSIKLTVNYFLGPLLFVVLSYSLYKQIINQPDLQTRWQQIKLSWEHPLFWLVFILMFFNWGIESAKWKLLMKPLEKITLYKSIKSVFAGCSITMLTPNRTGEFGGRILFVKPENRIKAISTTILGSVSQLAITTFTGTIGLCYLKYFSGYETQLQKLPWIFNDLFFLISILLTIILLLLFFKIHFFIVIVSKLSFIKKLIIHIDIIDSFTSKELLRILMYSFIRYLVFILQFILMLHVMHVSIGFYINFWLLTVFYLMMVLLPTIGFTELPVRAAASVLILGLFSNNILGIQVASFGIWLINLVLPAIIGSIFMFRIKIMKVK